MLKITGLPFAGLNLFCGAIATNDVVGYVGDVERRHLLTTSATRLLVHSFTKKITQLSKKIIKEREINNV
jgi:hypothetical protein